MKQIGIAIIGCGMIAEFHAMAVAADGRAKVVAAAYGTNEGKGRAFAERFHIPKLVSDYHELLGDPEITGVLICTPSSLHGQCAIDFANHGVHILCEKPLDISASIMTEMIRAAEQNAVKLGCVFPNRVRLGLNRAKEVLDSGALGPMYIVECQYRGYRSPLYFSTSKWKGTQQYDGGGCLMNQGIHAIDLMMYLAGDVRSTCAQVGTLGRDIEVEDTAAALLDFANGAQGFLAGTTLSHLPEDAPEGDRIRIECARGSILYANGKTTLFKNRKDDDFDVEETSLDDTVWSAESSGSKPENIDWEGHQIIVSNFLSAILDDVPLLIPARSARRGVDLVLTIYKSSKKRCWLPVSYGD